MTLRVAVVALYPAPGAKAPGGVRAVVQNLVHGLRSFNDLDVHLVHCHADIEQGLTTEDNGVQVEYIAMPKRRVVPNTLRAILQVERVLRKVQPEVVNTHAAHYTIAALRAGFPTVFTIHGVVRREAAVYRSTMFDRARFTLEDWLERYAVQHVRDIVAISPYVLEEYGSRSNARFHRIDNPLSPDFFEIPNVEEEGRLLYAGTIDERKNIMGLLRAFAIVHKRAPHARLRIAGRATNPAYLQASREMAEREGLGPHVEFLGLQNKTTMLEEYARCTALVLASQQETAPMAVSEAMAAAKPVVATAVGGVPDLVEDGVSGFLAAAGDMAGFAQSILRLLADKELRHHMGQHGRERAQRFRAEIVAARYRQLYYQIAGKSMP
jgi:glycosyltransferase involved in cell wall biosynthesis